MTAPLTGIKVLDLTRAMAGPFCTQLLGDLGAEVIKVESIQGGDETRYWGPFWNEISGYFLSANRNKKSIAVNLKDQAGFRIVATLAERADVFIENFRPGAVGRLGLDYSSLAYTNPRLVYCSLSGFGQDGPCAQEPAYNLLMQGFAGLMSLTGFADGEPTRAGLPVTDLTAGLYAAIGILTALYSRESTGEGQKVETSLLEGQISWLSYYLVGYLANGVIPRGMGSAHHSLAPYRAYKACDGYFVIAVGNDMQWKRLCEALGAVDLGNDERLLTNTGRLKFRDDMDAALNKIFKEYTVSELVERINTYEVPCGPINTIDQVVNDPQVSHLHMIEQVPHAKIPDLALCGVPIKFSKTPGRIQTAPPMHGEHTDQILSGMGFSPEKIAELRMKGIVA
ncbi:MAG: CoA transferase [Anaerolineales bacterium]|nr:CoA transferase [Anaerolineales bacterium]